MSNDNVTSAQIAMLIESDRELKEIIRDNAKVQDKRQEETNKILNELLIAQTKSEERQLADREWQKSVEKHQDKQDAAIKESKDNFQKWLKEDFTPVRDAQRDNTKFVNKWVGVGGTVFGACVTTVFFLIRGIIGG